MFALLTKSVAVYCGNNGYPIRCNSIHPGYIWTSMVRNVREYLPDIETEEELKSTLVERHPIGRVFVLDDIANGVLFLASDASEFMTGSELVTMADIRLPSATKTKCSAVTRLHIGWFSGFSPSRLMF